jgi:hypothetical protein
MGAIQVGDIPNHPWGNLYLASGHAGYTFSSCDRPLQWHGQRFGL